jgi:hypothetical protein
MRRICPESVAAISAAMWLLLSGGFGKVNAPRSIPIPD